MLTAVVGGWRSVVLASTDVEAEMPNRTTLGGYFFPERSSRKPCLRVTYRH
jgi:hypothetical protein